ncbi:MAG: hypothetical protein IPK55_11625 [Streptococcus sp.]|nr:hypothetical protein [Streptococcus sp.]
METTLEIIDISEFRMSEESNVNSVSSESKKTTDFWSEDLSTIFSKPDESMETSDEMNLNREFHTQQFVTDIFNRCIFPVNDSIKNDSFEMIVFVRSKLDERILNSMLSSAKESFSISKSKEFRKVLN